MSGADPNSRPIEEERRAARRGDRCARCGQAILTEPAEISAGYPSQRYALWTLCDRCFLTCMSAIQEVIIRGAAWGHLASERRPGTDPAPRRRRHKSDP